LYLKKAKNIYLLALIATLFIIVPVSAQEGDPTGPIYLVQAGDTLSSIALRFDIPVAEIISQNAITDPDALNVGDGIVLPGIDWIDGTLILDEVDLGESYLSLRRKYLLDEESFGRLNRITSPHQLYFGFSALLAIERGENIESARVIVGLGESILEMALMAGENPWSVVSYNQIEGNWALIPGDVLFTPTTDNVGPGALPSPISQINVEGQALIQGKTAVIRVTATDVLSLGGKLIGHELQFFEEGSNQLVALKCIGLASREGNYSIVISGEYEGESFSYSQTIRVKDGGYDRETLTVDLALLDPELSNLETSYLREVMNSASSEKYWQGYWGAPHPYIDVINSEFGVERSYNQGAFQGFHYGIDFGGGVGIEVWAPASGIVVLAELLEVRGNATIIDHGWGIYSLYFHQSEIKVSVGDFVESGQLIGLVGNTDRSSGAHLHWEVWANGEAVEPMDWINLVFP